MADLPDTRQVRSGAVGLDIPPQLHIVDQLIAERGQKIVRSWTWPFIKPFLYMILHYREAVRMANEIAPLSGIAAMEYVSKLLSLDLEIDRT